MNDSKLYYFLNTLFLIVYIFALLCMLLSHQFCSWHCTPENIVSYYIENIINHNIIGERKYFGKTHILIDTRDSNKVGIINSIGYNIINFSCNSDLEEYQNEVKNKSYYLFGPNILLSGSVDIECAHQKKFNNSFLICISMSLLLFLFGMMKCKKYCYIGITMLSLVVFICSPILSYDLSYNRNLYHELQKNKDYLKKILISSKQFDCKKCHFLNGLKSNCDFIDNYETNTTSPKPTSFQKYNIHQGRVFLGTSPDGIRYIRISDKFFIHFFYVPNRNKNELMKFNPEMSFKKLDNDFFIGYYDKPIKTLNVFFIMYIVSLILLFVCLFLVVGQKFLGGAKNHQPQTTQHS